MRRAPKTDEIEALIDLGLLDHALSEARLVQTLKVRKERRILRGAVNHHVALVMAKAPKRTAPVRPHRHFREHEGIRVWRDYFIERGIGGEFFLYQRDSEGRRVFDPNLGLQWNDINCAARRPDGRGGERVVKWPRDRAEHRRTPRIAFARARVVLGLDNGRQDFVGPIYRNAAQRVLDEVERRRLQELEEERQAARLRRRHLLVTNRRSAGSKRTEPDFEMRWLEEDGGHFRIVTGPTPPPRFCGYCRARFFASHDCPGRHGLFPALLVLEKTIKQKAGTS